MKSKSEDFIEDLEDCLNTIRKCAEELDGRNSIVKHIRTCVYTAKDLLNKLARLEEMIEDETEANINSNNTNN